MIKRLTDEQFWVSELRRLGYEVNKRPPAKTQEQHRAKRRSRYIRFMREHGASFWCISRDLDLSPERVRGIYKKECGYSDPPLAEIRAREKKHRMLLLGMSFEKWLRQQEK